MTCPKVLRVTAQQALALIVPSNSSNFFDALPAATADAPRHQDPVASPETQVRATRADGGQGREG
jgi:hypothetical protein